LRTQIVALFIFLASAAQAETIQVAKILEDNGGSYVDPAFTYGDDGTAWITGLHCEPMGECSLPIGPIRGGWPGL
jgi:hypothetical protein